MIEFHLIVYWMLSCTNLIFLSDAVLHKIILSDEVLFNFFVGCCPTYNTVFLLKIRHENNNIALASPNFLEVNIQRFVCVRIPFPFIAYTHDDLCRKIRNYIQSFGKGCRIIRRAEFLEEIR